MVNEKIQAKHNLLQQIANEIESRRAAIEKITAEVNQLEQQGLLVQGAILALEELAEEAESESAEPETVE